MIWLLATRGAAWRPTDQLEETVIPGVHSVVYKPGVLVVPIMVGEIEPIFTGEYERGAHRLSGYLYTRDGSAAETLLDMTDEVDLVIRYQAHGQFRRRILSDVIFMGDALVTIPALNSGEVETIGVPFRVQMPNNDTFADHVSDEEDT